MRRRNIRPNTRSFTGRHVGTPGSPAVRFESGLERDLLTLLRFRTDVVEIVEQPFTVEFTDAAGRPRSYTPDFKVIFTHQTSIYEVKFRKDLRAKWDTYREPYLYLRQWARQRGWFFRVMTEGAIRTVRFHNADMLLPHRAREPHPEMARRITAQLAHGPLSILQLLTTTCPDNTDRAAFYAALWPMLAKGMVVADFDRPLGMSMAVELPR